MNFLTSKNNINTCYNCGFPLVHNAHLGRCVMILNNSEFTQYVTNSNKIYLFNFKNMMIHKLTNQYAGILVNKSRDNNYGNVYMLNDLDINTFIKKVKKKIALNEDQNFFVYLKIPGEFNIYKNVYESKDINNFNSLRSLVKNIIIDIYPINSNNRNHFFTSLYCKNIYSNLYYYDNYGKIKLI